MIRRKTNSHQAPRLDGIAALSRIGAGYRGIGKSSPRATDRTLSVPSAGNGRNRRGRRCVGNARVSFGAAVAAVAAGRKELIRLHQSGEIHDSILRAIESELDLEELRFPSTARRREGCLIAHPIVIISCIEKNSLDVDSMPAA